MFELKMVADYGTVPVPISKYAVLFVGLDGRMRARLNGGQIVDVVDGVQGIKGDTGQQGVPGAKGDTGQQGATGAKGDTGQQGVPGVKGDTGQQGAPGAKGDTGQNGINGINGLLGSVRSNFLDIAVPVAGALEMHSYMYAGSLLNKQVTALGMLVINSNGNTNLSVQLSLGGVVIDFPQFGSNGQRQWLLEVEAMVDARGKVWAFLKQSSTAVGGGAQQILFVKSSTSAGVLANGTVSLRIMGTGNALTASPQLVSIEVKG